MLDQTRCLLDQPNVALPSSKVEAREDYPTLLESQGARDLAPAWV